MYPSTSKAPNGKLRLLYECNPLAFIIEQAGGAATDGFERIMSKQISSIHERTPIIIGSSEMVEQAHAFMRIHTEVKA